MSVTAKIRKHTKSISTKPNKRNWLWNNSFSLLAFVLLISIYILRFLSALQILKTVVRVVKEARNKADKDLVSKRTNVPPIWVEVYFLGAILIFTLIYLSTCRSVFANILSYYFIAESSVWVLYYFVLRRFFEEKYAIMHALEYILLIPLVIIGQGLCFAIVSDVPFLYSIGTILNPSATDPIYISILNILYVAVVIGVVISTLPSERIKEKGINKYDISVVGAGSVVTSRLLPAIKKANRMLDIAIYDLAYTDYEKPEDKQIGKIQIVYKPIDNDLRRNILNSNILWIATPSHTRFMYLEEFISKDIFIVVEKPLTSLKSEYSILTELLMSNKKKVFCLSYYYLEKALPLVYLFNPLNFYEKYLKLPQEKGRCEVLATISQLGSVQKVQMYILEHEDERQWLKSSLYGGQYMETFVHLALLNKMIFGIDSIWDNLNWKLGDYANEYEGSYVECCGKVGDAEFQLYVGKFMPQKKRKGVIEFEYGRVEVDFETSQCICTFYNNEALNFTISLNRDYPKYGIQFDMVYRCYHDDIIPHLVDGSYLQIKTLEWLFQNDLSKVKHFSYDATNDTNYFNGLFE